MPNQATIEGFVLVGGKSRRMGRDKARLELSGKPLVLRAVELLAPFVTSVTLLGPTQVYGDLGLPILPDQWPDRGPLGAICTALLHTKSEWNIFLACDLPQLSSNFVRVLSLRVQGSRSDAVVPQLVDGWQPLCAAYRSRSVGAFEYAIKNGELSLRDLLGGLKVEKLSQEFLSRTGIEPQQFTNVNTAQDWEEVRPRIKT